ncbi:hypothetical protein MBOU_19880 [Mycobacterium bourgelatii]|uniref:Uncharacterized protein n=1 Tax=Mycobacterium bourgelatii TaxID=1273442 RepID=A0A7I9YMN3_MYCBU|nr:hypothetical protein MBOU_19880 [Mycobacterium bourgelatii]
MATHFAELLPGPKELVALGELADDLIRRVPPALVRCHVVVDSSCPNTRASESHNDWTTTTGSPHSPQMTQAEYAEMSSQMETASAHMTRAIELMDAAEQAAN